jgi:hypothetical protein
MSRIGKIARSRCLFGRICVHLWHRHQVAQNQGESSLVKIKVNQGILKHFLCAIISMHPMRGRLSAKAALAADPWLKPSPKVKLSRSASRSVAVIFGMTRLEQIRFGIFAKNLLQH